MRCLTVSVSCACAIYIPTTDSSVASTNRLMPFFMIVSFFISNFFLFVRVAHLTGASPMSRHIFCPFHYILSKVPKTSPLEGNFYDCLTFDAIFKKIFNNPSLSVQRYAKSLTLLPHLTAFYRILPHLTAFYR